MSDFENWTKLAYQFGPFMFALLFCLIITRWGYKIYQRANLRTPPASDREKNTYRIYFISTAAFGFLLVITSVVWWVFNQPSVYIFKGEIAGLREYEKIVSNELYLRRVEVEIPGETTENNLRISNEYFVYVQEKPITDGQVFTLYYRKENGRHELFNINYRGDEAAKYEIQWDEDSGKNVLKYIESPKESGLSFLVNTAYAEPLQPEEEGQFLVQQIGKKHTDLDLSAKNLVRLLQNERTGVGLKIEVLEAVLGLEDESFSEFIKTSTTKEPVIITLLDLSRHTDKELGFNARRILNDKLKLDNFLSLSLVSDDPEMHQSAKSILFSLESPRANDILENILQFQNNPRILELKEIILSERKSRILIPSGSEKGDRYYVKAAWDPENSEVVTCLTNLFNGALISVRTIEEEKKIMADRKNRFVYWYSKEWALRMALEIERCGGTAEFVGF
ncbi:MAG: hypothetical protein V3W18_12155 [candidate division Zixibacteria bacterium]